VVGLGISEPSTAMDVWRKRCFTLPLKKQQSHWNFVGAAIWYPVFPEVFHSELNFPESHG